MDPQQHDAPQKSDVESRLDATAQDMADRVSSIRAEVSDTGTSIRNWMVQHPLKSVGGMLAAGLAVGWMTGGRSQWRRRKKHEELVDQYLDALRAEVESAVDRGEEPGPALEKALRDRVPMVVYSGEKRGASSGGLRRILGEGLEMVVSTGLSLVARDVVESMLAETEVGDAVTEEVLE
jgi:hypothetical protein